MLANSQPVTVITTLNQTVHVYLAPTPTTTSPDSPRAMLIENHMTIRNVIWDIMIPVIGPSGGGKSTFIKNVFAALGEKENIAVDDGFGSCTLNPTPYHIDIPGDIADQYKLDFGDSEVISRLADWMTSKYTADIHLGGIVYALPVYRDIGKDDFGSIKAFRDICGKDVLQRVIIARTKHHIPGRGHLIPDHEIWNAFWDGYFPLPLKTVLPLGTTPESAWDVVKCILQRVKEEGTIPRRRRQPGLMSKITQILTAVDR
ncbi:hypothetical protein EST38_g7868 [Candolleomyces aberdarensis]|uniref:Uncharacterized protein n=1 Tax=Candolleomyces aberdarensis TaxID=2316362 RepID=A0A4Q2DEM2_9AGAR|nr:hypothetical protein EST38_g7868 [Candolleomyces aberdarensis]